MFLLGIWKRLDYTILKSKNNSDTVKLKERA